MPLEKAEANTTTSGSTTKIVRKEIASATMMNRIGLGSFSRSLATAIRSARSLTACIAGGGMARSAVAVEPRIGLACVTKRVSVDIDRPSMRGNAGLRPALQAIDDEDDQERSQQHDDGNRRR